MTDRATPPDHDDDLPPIPTGGLGDVFPEWLRERPAWAMPTVVIDDSPIDPRELVELDDLPDWLHAIATDRERRLEGITLPDLDDRPSVSMSEGGVDAASVATDAVATPTDASIPPVVEVSAAIDDSQAVADEVPEPATTGDVSATPQTEPAPDLDVETPALPFPNYVKPPQASPRGRDVTTSLRNDPVLVALVVAAVAIVFGTVVLLIVQ